MLARLRLLPNAPVGLAAVRLCLIAGLAALAGCAAPSRPLPYACLLPSEHRMLVAELFFGRAVPGRADVTAAEWTDFVDRTLAPHFPDGFTVFDAEGRWRGMGEKTIVVLIATRRAPDLASRLAAVIQASEQRFRQKSVGLVTRDSCAAF
jgi:hypothetical protein